MALGARNRIDQETMEHKRHERGGVFTWLLMIIVLLLLVGIVVYGLYSGNWRAAESDGRGQVKQALGSVKDASENVVITSKVKAALALSKQVSASDINVDTRDGIVTLQGRVPSQESRRLAEQIARDTSGVKQVRNELAVSSEGTKPNQDVTQLGTRVSDLELRTRLEDTYEKEDSLKDDRIKTDVRDGVVSLEGEVDSSQEKLIAESRARDIGDVKDVRNNLKIRGQEDGEEPRDELAKRVEFELYSSRAFDLASIQVSSNQGVVILDGQVRSEAEKLLASKLATDVEGVKSVRNNLSVGTPMTTETQPTE